MSQIAFEWPQPTSYAPADYIISDSNADAVNLLDKLLKEKAKSAFLYGKKLSGKTHLVHYWLSQIGGDILDKSLLGKLPSHQLWPLNSPAVLEDIETIKDETALFHLLRHSEENGKLLLLTANFPAKKLSFTLPDLTSRLVALPSVALQAPDDKLLTIYIAKYFSDRQLRVSEEVMSYIINHGERSFTSAHDTLSKIEKASLENKRNITIPLVKALFNE